MSEREREREREILVLNNLQALICHIYIYIERESKSERARERERERGRERENLALNNLQVLICQEAQPTNIIQIYLTHMCESKILSLRIRVDREVMSTKDYLTDFQNWSLTTGYSFISYPGHFFSVF